MNFKRVMLILIVLLIVALLGVFGYILLEGQGEQGDDKEINYDEYNFDPLEADIGEYNYYIGGDGDAFIEPEIKPEPPVEEKPAPEGVAGDVYGTLTIGNQTVKVYDSWNRENIKKGACKYSGSLSEGKLMIVGSNSKTCFGGLKDLDAGGSIKFTDANGNKYSYYIGEIETYEGDDKADMYEGRWDMTLLTKMPTGNKRLAVRLHRV